MARSAQPGDAESCIERVILQFTRLRELNRQNRTAIQSVNRKLAGLRVKAMAIIAVVIRAVPSVAR